MIRYNSYVLICIVIVALLATIQFTCRVKAEEQTAEKYGHEQLDFKDIVAFEPEERKEIEKKLTAQQMKELELAMTKLDTSDFYEYPDTGCHYHHFSNSTFEYKCNIKVDKKIEGIHVKFRSTVLVKVNIHQEKAEVKFTFNGKTIYQKTLSVHNLTIPLCAPLPVVKKFLNLCLDISHIRFSRKHDCFLAKFAVDLKVHLKFIPVKKINIISPHEFGYHIHRCQNLSQKNVYQLNN